MTSFIPQIISARGNWSATASSTKYRPHTQEVTNYALSALLLDVLVTFVALVLAKLAAETALSQAIDVVISAPFLAFVLITWAAMFLLWAVYPDEKAHRMRAEAIRAAFAVGNAWCILIAVIAMTGIDLPREFAITFLSVNSIGVVFWRVIAKFALRATTVNRGEPRTLIVSMQPLSQQFAEQLRYSKQSAFAICGVVADETNAPTDFPIVGSIQDDLQTIIEQHRVEAVILVLPTQRDEEFSALVAELRTFPVRLHLIPEIIEKHFYPTTHDMEKLMISSVIPNAMSMQARILKRLVDIILASMGLLLVLPVFIVIAIAIKLDSPGPIFFKQLRVGEYRRRFYMYKFRSMVVNAEKLQTNVNIVDEKGNTLHKRKDDPRVTRVGRIIRKTSLDELPQLINVLLGDMSLVGPRPEMPWVVNNYERWQYQRFQVPPGITGWWQVNGRSEEKPMHLSTEDDLYYIANYSLWLDLKIIVKTIPVLLSGKGSF